MENSVVSTWRSAEIPVSIASWDPVDAASRLTNVVRAERLRQLKVSSVDGSVEEADGPCRVSEPLVAVLVEFQGRFLTPAGHSVVVDKSQG